MSVSVTLPTQLRQLAGGKTVVEVDGGTVAEAIAELDRRCPGMAARLLEDSGDLRRFVNVYVNSEDVRFQQGLQTPLPEGAEVAIIPAVAGGALVRFIPL